MPSRTRLISYVGVLTSPMSTCLRHALADSSRPPADLLNASLVLPFLTADAFDDVWERIVSSLGDGSRFAGHLFGERDEWATLTNRTHHTRAQVESLLSNFDIEHLDEREYDGQTALGAPKHWH